MSDAEAKVEEVEVEVEILEDEKDELQERRDLATFRFPQRKGELPEAYGERIEKIIQILPGMWQPGQSGNPHGKRKRVSGNFKDAIEYAMGEKIHLKFVDGDIEGLVKINRKELFMKNLMSMLTHGQVVFPELGPRGGPGNMEGRTASLNAKDWAEFALKFLRYIDPPLPAEKTTEVRQVVFDLGTMLPTKVKQKIIKQKTGRDAIIYEEQEYLEGEVLDDDGSDGSEMVEER